MGGGEGRLLRQEARLRAQRREHLRLARGLAVHRGLVLRLERSRWGRRALKWALAAALEAHHLLLHHARPLLGVLALLLQHLVLAGELIGLLLGLLLVCDRHRRLVLHLVVRFLEHLLLLVLPVFCILRIVLGALQLQALLRHPELDGGVGNLAGRRGMSNGRNGWRRGLWAVGSGEGGGGDGVRGDL